MTDENRRRDLLHMSIIREFAGWAINNGYIEEQRRSEYEVLRLRHGHNAPIIFYEHHGGEHATSTGKGTALVNRWMRERRRLSYQRPA